jgi:AcrR family transcriptional regulator
MPRVPAPVRPRTGRRPGAGGTREVILGAARIEFAAHGYRGATIRGIAGRAGVDAALIGHYFGHKDDLFRAALETPGAASSLLEALTAGPDGAGERLARAYLSYWEDPESRTRVLSTLASVATHPEARERLAAMSSELPVGKVGWLADDAPELRLTLAVSQLIGVALARYLVGFPPLVSIDFEQVVAAVAPTVQHHLTGPLPESETDHVV